MKNIHLLPTDKPSRIYLIKSNNKLGITSDNPFYTENMGSGTQNQHIYITSDEKIKEGDWYIYGENVLKANFTHKPLHKVKIILSTDQDLIKDGVQAIDDEFLEWFVNNPSCEEVEVVDNLKYFNVDELRERHLKGLPHLYSEKIGYKIIIPKEEPKQETLEEVAKSHAIYELENNYKPTKESFKLACKRNFIRGAKWQQEQCKKDLDAHLDVAEDLWLEVVKQNKKSYSEEDTIDLIRFLSMYEEFNQEGSVSKETAKYFLEKFKKK